MMMDEFAVSFHTPATKKQSKQYVCEKRSARPNKGRAHATRTEQVVLNFFDGNYIPVGKTINALYVHQEGSGRIPGRFRKKTSIILSRNWFLHWDNAPIQKLRYSGVPGGEKSGYGPPPSLFAGSCHSDLFFFLRVKSELAVLKLSQDSFKTSPEDALRIITKD